MQGRLRGERVSASIGSECAACRGPIVFTIDSGFRWRILSGQAAPLVFQPSIDWAAFRAPTIIDDY